MIYVNLICNLIVRRGREGTKAGEWDQRFRCYASVGEPKYNIYFISLMNGYKNYIIYTYTQYICLNISCNSTNIMNQCDTIYQWYFVYFNGITLQTINIVSAILYKTFTYDNYFISSTFEFNI